jgi:hypothetical protein
MFINFKQNFIQCYWLKKLSESIICAMKCISCQREIAEGSRFCNYCGVEQTAGVSDSARPVILPLGEEFDWLEREARLDPALNYEAQRRFQGPVGLAFGCLGYFGGFLILLVALVPGVPLLAVFGLPLALALGLLTYFNAWNLQERWGKLPLLKNLPGLHQKGLALSASVTAYTGVLSLLCLALMIVTQRR